MSIKIYIFLRLVFGNGIVSTVLFVAPADLDLTRYKNPNIFDKSSIDHRYFINQNTISKLPNTTKYKVTQYAQGVVLASVRRRFNVMDVVWMSKRCRVLTGQRYLSLTFLLSFSFGF